MPAATCRKPAVRRFSRTARQLSVPLAADVRGLGTLCGSRSVTDARCGSGAVLRMSVFPVFGLLKGFQNRPFLVAFQAASSEETTLCKAGGSARPRHSS